MGASGPEREERRAFERELSGMAPHRDAREPVPLGPGNVFQALVLGPTSIPRIDVDGAPQGPELAVLSALAHAPHDADINR